MVPRSKIWAHSSMVERCPDKTEVLGSIPSAPTSEAQIYYGAGNAACPAPSFALVRGPDKTEADGSIPSTRTRVGDGRIAQW